MWVSINGGSQTWMVYDRTTKKEMDDLGVPFMETRSKYLGMHGIIMACSDHGIVISIDAPVGRVIYSPHFPPKNL